MGQRYLAIFIFCLFSFNLLTHAHKTRSTSAEKGAIFERFLECLAEKKCASDEISTKETVLSGELIYKGDMDEASMQALCQMYWLKKLTLQIAFTPEIFRAMNETQKEVDAKGKRRATGLHNLRSLTHLTLSSCGLATLPRFIWTLDKLVFLGLSHNKLTRQSFPQGAFSKLKKLKVLFLNHNRFKEFPPFCNHLPRLEVLNLSENDVRDLPAALWHMKNLQRLALRDMNKRDLPEKIVALPKLVSLDLRNNPELTLSENQLTFLQGINVKDEGTPYTGTFSDKEDKSALDEEVATEKIKYEGYIDKKILERLIVKGMREIHIIATNEGPVHLDIFYVLPLSVKVFSLKANKIHYKERSLKHLDLESIKLEGALRIVPLFLKKQTTLKHLDLSNNAIIDFPPWVATAMPELELINMQNNYLKYLPGNVELLENLQTVNFSRNVFRFMPKMLTRMRQRENFTLIFDLSQDRRNELHTSSASPCHTQPQRRHMPTSRSVHRGLGKERLFEGE